MRATTTRGESSQAVTPLVVALQALGLDRRGILVAVRLDGRWIVLQGERCRVNVVTTPWGDRYYTWCDDREGRTIEAHDDPNTAILTGLRRAAQGRKT